VQAHTAPREFTYNLWMHPAYWTELTALRKILMLAFTSKRQGEIRIKTVVEHAGFTWMLSWWAAVCSSFFGQSRLDAFIDFVRCILCQ
jgi:hypothetical protein